MKTSELLDLDNDTCFETIRYTFEVTNEGNVDLTNVVLTDPLFNGEVAGPDEGDIFSDGVLGLDEVWIYQALYAIQQVDIDNGEVINQAQVVATNLLGNFNTSDDSDDNSVLEDDATVTIVRDNCDEGSPSIALIKESELLDLDNDGCNETIQYTFIVDNTGDIGLEEVVLQDNELFSGDIPGPILGDDNDGILEPDENWVYGAVYNVTPEDIIEEEVVNQAIVSAKPLGIDGNVQDLSDDDSFLEDDPTITIVRDTCDEGAPDIAMIKEGILIDADADGCEDSIRYTFIVDNTGDVDLQDVKVEDNELFTEDIPGPESGDENNNGILETNETWTYIILYDILQEDIDLGQVVNQAQVSANPINANGVVLDLSDDDSFLEDGPTITPVKDACDEGAPSIALIKQGVLIDLDGDGCEESIRYTFIVDNTGDVDLEGVKVEDNELFSEDIPGPESGDNNNNGILETDETWTYIILYTIIQGDIDSGEVINQAQVSASPINDNGIVIDLSDDDSFLEDDKTVTQVGDELCDGGSASIALIKQGLLIDLDEDGCDETIHYTFTVVNTGDIDLEEVVLADEELFSEDIPGPQSGDDNNNDLLETDETWIYIVLYDIEQDDINLGQVTNQAQVNASPINNDGIVLDTSDDDSFLEDDKTVTLVGNELCTSGSASIALIKQGVLVDLDEDGCNEAIQYTFTVENTGDTNLEEVVLEDNDLFSEDIQGPESGDDNNNDILEPNETWTYVILYNLVQQDVDNGEVINQAQVHASPVDNNGIVLDPSDDDSFLEDDPTVTLLEDVCDENGNALGLIKTSILVDLDNDGCFDSIEYTFTLENTGSNAIQGISLEDQLCGGIIPGPQSGDEENDNILDVGEIWTYLIFYDITQANIDIGQVVNQAKVSGAAVGNNNPVEDLSDDDSYLEDDPTITDVLDACNTISTGIGLIKQGVFVDLDNDDCEETIRYDFTVANLGDTDLENVQLSDELLGGVLEGLIISSESEDGILQAGETWQYSAVYEVAQQDIDMGSVPNQATVAANPVGSDAIVFDFSDDNSFLEDDITILETSDLCDSGSEGIIIYNGITPNGDGSNDYFQIIDIENFPNNTVQIFNRWGVLVYETDNYGQGNNVFRGISEGRLTIAQDRNLPSGTYFYIITFPEENPGKPRYNGYLYINRN
nr:gliding motility-associated C-terminal domain-containing protein [uncultured Allomuricauda sp.]